VSTATPPLPTVGHVLHRMDVAGAEVLAAGLCRKLNGLFRCVLLCLDDRGPLAEQLMREGVAVEHLHRRPGRDLALARRLRDACTRHRIDLLHAHQYTPFFYAACSRTPLAGLRKCRTPILFTEHGRHYPDIRKPRRVLANKLLLRRGDRVTAVAEFVRQALVRNEAIPAHRIDVVHNGIDPGAYTHTSQADRDAARQRIRAELNLAADQPVLLQVARFHPVKDHATAVRAFAQVHAAHPDAVLLLAGDGERRQAIQQLAGELRVANGVRFLGVRRDVRDLMAAADVFVLSSLSEGLSVTLLEAMAAGLPIAATDVGGNGEVIEHSITGLLSPRGDAGQLAGHITRRPRTPHHPLHPGPHARSLRPPLSANARRRPAAIVHL
jgi:L-malate glycosyltransferase